MSKNYRNLLVVALLLLPAGVSLALEPLTGQYNRCRRAVLMIQWRLQHSRLTPTARATMEKTAQMQIRAVMKTAAQIMEEGPNRTWQMMATVVYARSSELAAQILPAAQVEQLHAEAVMNGVEKCRDIFKAVRGMTEADRGTMLPYLRLTSGFSEDAAATHQAFLETGVVPSLRRTLAGLAGRLQAEPGTARRLLSMAKILENGSLMRAARGGAVATAASQLAEMSTLALEQLAILGKVTRVIK